MTSQNGGGRDEALALAPAAPICDDQAIIDDLKGRRFKISIDLVQHSDAIIAVYFPRQIPVFSLFFSSPFIHFICTLISSLNIAMQACSRRTRSSDDGAGIERLISSGKETSFLWPARVYIQLCVVPPRSLHEEPAKPDRAAEGMARPHFQCTGAPASRCGVAPSCGRLCSAPPSAVAGAFLHVY